MLIHIGKSIPNTGGQKLWQLRHMWRNSGPAAVIGVDLPEVWGDNRTVLDRLVHCLPAPFAGDGGATQLHRLGEYK
jgi:hypothetical protein